MLWRLKNKKQPGLSQACEPARVRSCEVLSEFNSRQVEQDFVGQIGRCYLGVESAQQVENDGAQQEGEVVLLLR